MFGRKNISPNEYGMYALKSSVAFRFIGQASQELSEMGEGMASDFESLARLALFVDEGRPLSKEEISIAITNPFLLISDMATQANSTELLLREYYLAAVWFETVNSWYGKNGLALSQIEEVEYASPSKPAQERVWQLLRKCFPFPSERKVRATEKKGGSARDFVPIALDQWRRSGRNDQFMGPWGKG